MIVMLTLCIVYLHLYHVNVFHLHYCFKLEEHNAYKVHEVGPN